MEELALKVFGTAANLLWWQMAARAALTFFVALVLIRISGRRSFSMKSPFDNTVVILLGAVLARAIVGASPLIGTYAAALGLVALHRICAWICIYSPAVNRLFKGSPISLYEHGKINRRNLYRSLITEEELLEEMRMNGNTTTLDTIDKIILEGNGKVSIIKKE